MPIIPVHDGKALTYIARPYVAWGLILAIIRVYLVVEGGGFETEASQASVLSFGLIPAVFNNFAELPPDLAEPGRRFEIRVDGGRMVEAETVAVPFYDPDNKRQDM